MNTRVRPRASPLAPSSLSLEELPDFVVARVARDCALLLRICVGEATEITSVTGRTKRREEKRRESEVVACSVTEFFEEKNRLRRRKRKRRRGRRSSITIVIVIYCIRTEYE